MKNECSFVRDVLPLYFENMVSEDTATFVEEHLKTCSECAAELEAMKAGKQIDEAAAPQDKNDANALVAIKKKIQNFNIINHILFSTNIIKKIYKKSKPAAGRFGRHARFSCPPMGKNPKNRRLPTYLMVLRQICTIFVSKTVQKALYCIFQNDII